MRIRTSLKSKTSAGLTLIELLLVMAVVAVFILMASRYYQSTVRSQQANEMIDFVNDVTAAAMAYGQGSPNGFQSITVDNLVATGNIPQQFVSAATVSGGKSGSTTETLLTSPSGGAVTITATSFATVTFEIDSLASYLCRTLALKLTNLNGVCSLTKETADTTSNTFTFDVSTNPVSNSN